MSRRMQVLMVLCGATALILVPELAVAAEEAAAEVLPWQTEVGKAIGAGTAMGISALAAGYAQAKIGSAGAGTLAERPEAGTNIIVLQALPEIVALLGFAIAFLILG